MNTDMEPRCAAVFAWTCVGFALCTVTPRPAGAVEPIGTALTESKPIIEVRVRTESVDQEPLADNADAVTIRARLGVETGKAWGTSLLVEGEGVWPLANDYRADNARLTHLTQPIVADPEGYEINRLQLTNTRLPGTTLTVGRQRLLLDDQRFIGNVGWRQNEQTYDAFRVVNKSVAQLTLDVGYFNQANRIFGPESPQGRYTGDNYFGNVAYQFPLGKLTGFAYLLDFDPVTRFPGLNAVQIAGLNPVRMSTQTYGARFTGERSLNKVKFSYAASYALQRDYERNPLQFSLDYRLLELSAAWRMFTAGIGQEVMEGNGTVGFSTPLATLHKFQGWADKFLTTPAAGIDDRYLNAGYSIQGLGMLDTLSATTSYHFYATELRGVDLGEELNLQVQVKWQRFLAMLKYADYRVSKSETPAMFRDTSKFWVQLEYVW